MSSTEEPNWELRWDAEQGVLLVLISGEMTADASMAVLREISGGGPWPANAPTVWDLRSARIPNATGDRLRNLATRRERFEGRRNVRVAMVAEHDLEFGLMRMFEMLSDGEQSTFRVFRDFDAAVRWAADR